MSFFRRAGALIARFFTSAADLAAAAGEFQLYSKPALGVSQLYGRSDDGTVHQITPTSTVSSNFWDPPATPHAYDDEFNSTTIDPSWTVVNPLTLGIDPYAAMATGNPRYDLDSIRPSWLRLQPSVATSAILTKSVTFPGDFFIWYRGSYTSRNAITNNDGAVFLMIATNTSLSDTGIRIALNEADAGVRQAEFSSWVGGVYTVIAVTPAISGSTPQPIEAVGLQRIGTSYYAWVFGPNGSANMFGGPFTLADVISHVHINVFNTSTSSPGNCIGAFDFVRVVESSTFLP